MMKHGLPLILALAILVAPILAGKKERQVVPQLTKVTTVFVKGNGPAADKAREILREGKTCLSLALKENEAEAVMEVNEAAQAQSYGAGGIFGGRDVMVSVTITLADGSLIWSDSFKMGDAPFMSGAKSAMNCIFDDLKKAADCKGRKEKK